MKITAIEIETLLNVDKMESLKAVCEELFYGLHYTYTISTYRIPCTERDALSVTIKSVKNGVYTHGIEDLDYIEMRLANA